MSARKAAGTTAGVLGGTGGMVAAMVSPTPLLVLGGLAGLVVVALVVVVLTAVWSRDPIRCERALTVLDRLLSVVPGGRSAPGSTTATVRSVVAPVEVCPVEPTPTPTRARRARKIPTTSVVPQLPAT